MLTPSQHFRYKRDLTRKRKPIESSRIKIMKKTSAIPSVLICLFTALTFAVSSPAARASNPTTTWIGASNGDWFNPGNWNNGVPDYSKDAFINNGGRAEINHSGATARTLTLGEAPGNAGTVSVDGLNGGSLSVGSGPRPSSQPAAIPSDEGAIYVGYGGRGTLSITNSGTVSSESGFIAALANDPTVRQSNGAVTVDGGGSVWQIGGENDFRLFVGGASTQTSTFVDGGTALLSVTNSGAVQVDNYTQYVTSFIVGRSGTFTGGGSLTLNTPNFFSSLAQVRGTLAPSVGLKIYGNLRLFDQATTVCNVKPQVADRVEVIGVARLGARLQVTLDGTFTPAVTRYTLLHASGGIDPQFATFPNESIIYKPNNFTPRISYDAYNVYLDLDFLQ